MIKRNLNRTFEEEENQLLNENKIQESYNKVHLKDKLSFNFNFEIVSGQFYDQ